MFLRFTKKFSRPVRGFVIALLMLLVPALIATTVESAPQKNKTKAAPTPKKAAPVKKTQAKTKPTPKPDSKSKSKTNSKNAAQTASKNKTVNKKNEKTAAAKNDRKPGDRSKTSKTANTKNSKQTLAANNRIPSKNARNDRPAKTSDKNKKTSSKNNKSAADKNKTRLTTSKTAKPAVVKTTEKTTRKPRTNSKSKTAETNKAPEKTIEKTTETTAAATAELPQIIVTSFSVPVRSQAKADAAMLSNVRLGTVLKVTEKNPAWYKVQYSDGGKTTLGWISANAVNDLNAAGKNEIYRQIVERNYKPQMDFESASEFYAFLSSVNGELETSDKSAEIELKRLLALRSALKTIPADRRETAPYKDFLKAQEKEIVFNEPAGEWLVVSNEFWNLHTKYKKWTVSDTIAWEAANNPLPGECEGYVNCHLFDMRMRFGEYLNLHPNGQRAAEALRNMTDYLSPIVSDAAQKTVYNGPTDVTDRAEFNNLIAELRTIVARLRFVEKEKTLQQLRIIAEAYR
jgi:hypothetical protein